MIHRALPQDRETAPTVECHRGFAWRYAYARARETAAADGSGQDYLAFRCEDGRFVFALCDGVGQSFFGELAARWLGEGLVAWLWEGPSPRQDPSELRARLAVYLEVLAVGATEEVERQPLPAELPPLVREVLEQKRALGSQSTFVAGRVDLPDSSPPEGRILLTWMGDSRLRVWGPEGERRRELGDTFQVSERWSSRGGALGGEPHLLVAALPPAEHHHRISVMAYSDGLALLDGHQVPLPALELAQAIEDVASSPAGDDLSFLEVRPGGVPREWRTSTS